MPADSWNTGPDEGGARVVTPDGEVRLDHPYVYPGTPDGFQRLWTPHRMAYIKGADRPRPTDDGQAPAGGGCPFCRAPDVADDEGLVVHRGQDAFVVMNLYPYNTGHLLICPYRHVADYTDVTLQERAEVAELTVQAMQVLRAVVRPQGFNLGMNQGEAGGAGIAAHLHQHVVPRFVGDANFLPIIGRTKAMPQLLEDLRAALAEAWDDAVADARRAAARPDGPDDPGAAAGPADEPCPADPSGVA